MAITEEAAAAAGVRCLERMFEAGTGAEAVGAPRGSLFGFAQRFDRNLGHDRDRIIARPVR